MTTSEKPGSSEQVHFVPVPKPLTGLAGAALDVAEQGGNPDDLLKMLEHGLNKARPQQ